MQKYHVNSRPRQPKNGPNLTETRYQTLLEMRLRAGEIQWHGFEAIKLRLAPKTFYTPDFVVLDQSGQLEIHEVKGHWEDDARVKIKVAARLFPWMIFLGVTKVPKKAGGGWSFEHFYAE